MVRAPKSSRPSVRQRLRYTVDSVLSKGVSGVFLLALIGTLLILIVLPAAHFGITLNPNKNSILGIARGDQLIVIPASPEAPEFGNR
jgi:hypothetical protein